jgi:hypothetical protein
MALFGRLLRLHASPVPREDFVTAVFAGVLEAHPDLGLAWCAGLLTKRPAGATPSFAIATQCDSGRLESHLAGSRPDLAAVVTDDTGHDVIVVESKLGSGEGWEQLRRYAEHLGNRADARERRLVYLTRDPDPKDAVAITANLPNPVRFIQLRWHEVYRFLASHQQSALVREMLRLMEEEGMDQANQFSAADAIALAAFPRALGLMRESLRGDVEKRFSEALGGMRQYSTAMTQLHDHRRFILHEWMETGRWWCGIGYFLDAPDPAGFPYLGLIIEVDPRSSHRGVITKMMEAVLARGGWERQGWEPGGWASIRRAKSLRELMQCEDHVAAARDYFLELVNGLASIKAEFPQLPWAGAGPAPLDQLAPVGSPAPM